MTKAIGVLMLVALFTGIFCLAAREMGWRSAFGVFATVCGLLVWMAIAVALMQGVL